MSNPYNQFNIRCRPDARLPGVPANTSGSRLNFHNPFLGTVRLLSPAGSASSLSYDSQGLYNTLCGNTPAVARNDGTNFNAFGQLFGAQNPAYMSNCVCGTDISAPAFIPFGMGNQSVRLPQQTNFPGVLGMRMRSGGQENNIMQQFMTGSAAAMLRNYVPVMRPDAASVQNAFSVPAFPVVSAVPTDTVNAICDNVGIPFREVQWLPAGFQHAGVPQLPYAVEIKPENCDGFAPAIDAAFSVPVTGASSKTESADATSAPAVYLDIAMESSAAHLNANKRAADTQSFHSGGTAAKATKKTGRRKGNDRRRRPGVKGLKLPALKPCSVSLVRIDSSGIVRPRSNDSVEILSDDQELAESKPAEPECDAGSVPEVPEVIVDDEPSLTEPEYDASSLPEVPEVIVDDEQELTEPEFEPPLTEPEYDASSVPEAEEVLSDEDTPVSVIQEEVQEKVSSEQDLPLPVIQETANDSDSDQLIASDEDVGDDYPVHDDDNCSTNDDDSAEMPVYEVTTNSDALLFDMECDGEKAGEALRVLLPTKQVTPAGRRTASAEKSYSLPKTHTSKEVARIPAASVSEVITIPVNIDVGNSDDGNIIIAKKNYSLPKSHKPKEVGKVPAASVSEVITIPVNIDAGNSDDDDIIIASESPPPTANTSSVFSRMQRVAASACKEKISATQTRSESIEINRCENALIGVPLQSSFFRFEAQSSEVFRLLSMEKSFVPSNVLMHLMDLVASVDSTAVGSQSSSGTMPSGSVSRIPHGGSRTLLFQCLFCPYGELSAKRIMAHVKQQHQMYAAFIQRSLLPSRRILLHIYCRRCNFVAYDSAAMFIHFATYHKVPGILLAQRKDIEQDPDWAPVIDPESNAREFPFYACPNCRYLDAEWNRMIQHMLKKHSSESVFFGCVVRLIMFGRSSKYIGSFTYRSLARQERCKVARRQIYACVSCRFFSFYPTYAFCHYVINHSCLEMLYVCAASPSCAKQCTTVEDVISHIQGVHVAMKTLQFRCTATLVDALTSTEMNISPGELVDADVPVNINYQSSSASVRNSLEASIEIKDDDDDDVDGDRGDVTVVNPACEDDQSNDVEPESDEECTVNEAEASELSSKQNVPNRDMSKLGCSGQVRPVTERIVHSYRDDDADADIVLSSDDEESVVELNDANTNSVCSVADDLMQERDTEADSDCRVEAQASEIIDCDSQDEVVAHDFSRFEPQLVQNSSFPHTSFTLLTELVSSVVNSAYPDSDANPLANVAAASVGDFENSRSEESKQDTNAADLRSVQHSLSTGTPGTSHTELVNSDMNSTFQEQDLATAESHSVENPLSGTSRTELVNSDVNSAFSSNDADLKTDNAASVADCENCRHEVSKQQSVESPLSTDSSLTSLTELVNSAVNSAFLDMDADPQADNAAADAVNRASVSCSDDGSGCTQLGLVQDDGIGRTESVNSTEDPTFSSKDTNQLTETITAGTDDSTNHTSVAVDEESAAGLAVLCPGDLSSQKVARSCTVTEDKVRNPPLMDTSTAEPELFTSDQADGVEIFNELLAFDEDLLSSSEIPSDRRCMMDLDKDLLLLPDQLPADELQHPDQSSTPEPAVSMCSVPSEDMATDDATRDSLVVSMDDPCLPRCHDTSDDALCCDVTENEQLHMSSDSLPDARSKSVQGLCVDEILVPPYASCSSEIHSESRDLEATQPTESTGGQSKVSDSDDIPVAENRQRCKSLARFRFTASYSFTTKPS